MFKVITRLSAIEYRKTFLFVAVNSHDLIQRNWKFVYGFINSTLGERELLLPQISSNGKWFLSAGMGIYVTLSDFQ